MELVYRSTRNAQETATASMAILKGLANEGGLFVPDTIPAFDKSLEELSKMDYREVAYQVMKLMLTDFTEEELRHCINSAYDSKFDTKEIAPLVHKAGAYYLELFHGATIAFKDMALSILPYLLTTSAKKNDVKNEIVILTATSGDTGKAALAGFADVPGTKIIVFYPKHGVSPIQEKQMVTQKGDNTCVIGITGNFDDAQTGVKKMFSDKELNEYLASNEYPGRGIAVAMAPDGRQMFIGYFIMGRSENSRNRVFDPVPERGGICTIAADPAKLEDPSLIIYNPVLTLGKTHIVTNGDQTDTIYDLMSQGKSFADALRTRTFEPDGPNYTPRISAVVYADGSYQMSILKSADSNGDSVQRYFFDYPQPVAGEGHFISTYKHNGNPIPSFEGEPLRFACPRTIGDFAQGLWSSLNPDNKVSLFARVIDLDSGETGDMIFNKYDAVCSDLDDPEEPELLPEELELLKKLDAEEKQD